MKLYHWFGLSCTADRGCAQNKNLPSSKNHKSHTPQITEAFGRNCEIEKDARSNRGDCQHTNGPNTPSPVSLRGGKAITVRSTFFPFDSPLFLCVCLIMASSTKRADFEAVFPSLAQDILAHAKRYNLPDNALKWFEKVGQCPSPKHRTKVQF